MLTLHVLAGGELYVHVLNAMSTFVKQTGFLSLLRLSALVGIFMVTAGFIKTRDPMVFGRWFVGYLLITQLILLPKTTVMIEEVTSTAPKLVDNVPVVFALTAHLMTAIGFGLAQNYDALLALPDDLHYTQTGALFGARLIHASRDFRVIDPQLKEELDNYLRSCVVGDIRLNHKYSVSELSTSPNLWALISEKASPLRMTTVNGQLVSCQVAAGGEGPQSLRKKLEAEIKKAYSFYGVHLFGKPKATSYEQLFTTHLNSAFSYYQGLTDASSEIFLQSVMINALRDGISHYQTFTDATAGVVNQQFTKSQLQHRWSWDIAGLKALWFLPLLHSWLTLLLFGVFPVIMVLATLPGGLKILLSYVQFFLSLQFWPVLFALLNAGMTIYGSHQTQAFGALTLVNSDKVDELHQDLAGVAGYMMMLIPFLANGLVSNLSAAFNGLATSMTGHVQGSTMAVANEAASGSFGLGQTSFYNTTGNTLSANKHDSNWTNLQGLKTEQMASGVLKTITGDGSQVFDATPGMSRNAVSINTSEGLSGSLTQAYEQSVQAANNESQHYQTSLSNFAHRALQLSQLEGHDLRVGDGLSSSESAQTSQAISTMTSIASDVAKRAGMSQEESLMQLTSAGIGGHLNVSSEKSFLGHLGKLATGFSGGVDAHTKFERSSSTGERTHHSVDKGLSAREAHDFNQALNHLTHVAKTHHADESHTRTASLSNQMAADLRDAQTASHNYDASLSHSLRIQQAKNYVETHSALVNADFNQAFPSYVASRVGEEKRDELLGSPGNVQALQTLQVLGHDFIAEKREALIAQFGAQGASVDSFYQEKAQALSRQEAALGHAYSQNSHQLTHNAQALISGQETISSEGLPDITNHLDQAKAQVMQDAHRLKNLSLKEND